MINADLHSHTVISHGADTVAAMYEAGREAGLEIMGFSEHSPLPPGYACKLYTGDLEGDFPHYVREVLELKEHAAGPEVLLGMELDWIPSRRKWMEELTGRFPFDYVLGSIHFLDGQSVGNVASWPEDLTPAQCHARFAAYFYEIAAMAASGLVQAASHPDFVKLRAWDQYQSWLKTPQAAAAIDCAMTSLAKHNVAMEINSAGLRQDFAEPYPAEEVIVSAARRGVRICFGSDAHRKQDVGAGFAAISAIAARHGYRESVVFRNREAVVMPFIRNGRP